MKNNVVLWAAIALVGFGVYNNPNIDWLNNNNNIVIDTDSIDVKQPTDPKLLELSGRIGEFLGNDNRARKEWGELMSDLSLAVLLDGDKEVAASTREVREWNSVAGHYLELKLSEKYPDMMKLCNEEMLKYVSDKDVPLDTNLRKKASDYFGAVAWGALKEGK